MLWQWIVAVFEAIGAALTMDDAFLERVASQDVVAVAAGVALVGGISLMIGHSGILFVNGIRGGRFVLAFLLTGVLTFLLFAIWALFAFVFALPFTPATPDIDLLLRLFLLATAPLCFGFLIAIPYFGPVIARVLQGWTALILLALLRVLLDVGLIEAIIIAVGSWFTMQLVGRVASHPLNWLISRAWLLATGTPVLLSARDILAGHPMVEAVADVD